MGSNDLDRDKLSHDLVYSTLYIVEEYEGDLKALEKLCQELVAYVNSAAPAPDVSSQSKPNDSSDDPLQIAAKARFYYSIALNTAAQEREDKRMTAHREAEALFHRGQEQIKHHPFITLELPRRK